MNGFVEGLASFWGNFIGCLAEYCKQQNSRGYDLSNVVGQPFLIQMQPNRLSLRIRATSSPRTLTHFATQTNTTQTGLAMPRNMVYWSNLNSANVCQNTTSPIYLQWAYPNNFCSSNGAYLPPSKFFSSCSRNEYMLPLTKIFITQVNPQIRKPQ